MPRLGHAELPIRVSVLSTKTDPKKRRQRNVTHCLGWTQVPKTRTDLVSNLGLMHTLFKIGLKCDRNLEQKTDRFLVQVLGAKTGAKNRDQKFEVQ